MPANKERNIEWSKILLICLIAAFIFSFGTLLGYLLSSYTKSNLKIIEDGINNDLIEIQLQKDLLSKYPCADATLNRLTDRLASVGETLDFLEQKFGLNNPDVKNIKKLYILLQINHFTIEQEKNTQCNGNDTLILFFYSNNNEEEKGKDIANILSYIRANNKNVKTYTFDASVPVDSIETMRNYYNITALPAVIINNQLIRNIKSVNDIEPYIK